jgi:hypothetical protein
VFLSAMLVGESALTPAATVTFEAYPIAPFTWTSSRVAALFFSAAILGFLVRGGTQVVRAILNKAGSLPTLQTEVDEVEYNRGRLIGSIDRLLLAGVVAAGSYAGARDGCGRSASASFLKVVVTEMSRPGARSRSRTIALSQPVRPLSFAGGA